MNILRGGAVVAAIAVSSLLAGCVAAGGVVGPVPLDSGSPASQLKLGYLDNVTHAPALVGIQTGSLQEALGDTTLEPIAFNAGPAAIEALRSGAIDAAYIGPNPAINVFIQSGGASARVVSGVTLGGAALVVQPGIDSVTQLAGQTLATPQLGNTQDVALRSWLDSQGLQTSISGGGDVTITPTENSQTLRLFQDGKIAGAWLPEPWVSRLVIDAGAKVLVDEASLWQDGSFPTTVLLVNTDFLREHAPTVRSLIAGNLAAIDWLNSHPADAAGVINAKLQADTGKSLGDAVIARALQHVVFSADPRAATFQTLTDHGIAVGTQKNGSISGLFDLRLLNQLVSVPVSADGLGEE